MAYADTMTTIAELIQEHIDRTGDSYAHIAERAGLSKSAIHVLATDTDQRQLRTRTIDKLARGLQLPVRVVQAAAAATAGNLEDPVLERTVAVDRIVVLLEELTTDDLDVVRAVIEALRDRHGR